MSAANAGRELLPEWADAWRAHDTGTSTSQDPRTRLRLRAGTRADYAALAEYHYRAKKPATAMRVLVLEDTGGERCGERFAALHGRSWQSKESGDVVAVLIESLPSLSCRMRDAALDQRFGSHLEPAERAVLLNDEVRCISRVVVDPRWRGLGLAVRLVREALATATTPVTEALAAMGKVHPFFERAGMTAYPRPTHDFDARLVEAFASAGFERSCFLDPDALWRCVSQLPQAQALWLRRELRQWFRKNAGRGAVFDEDPLVQLRAVRERLGLEPVYYAWVRK